MNNKTGDVYLICFDIKYKIVKHYIGFCKKGNLQKRLKQHKSGNGSKLLNAVNAAGIKYKIVRVWHDVTRTFERELKRQKKFKKTLSNM